MSKSYDLEMSMLEDDLNEGSISPAEYDNMVRDLEMSYQEAAEEAAQDAYRREMDNW